ncbi:MAG: efflux RND transporter permease subunit [Acetobacteraceae bacterium]
MQVTTRYPGASALTVMKNVALPIEQSVNGVEGMIYMQSSSGSDGSYTLTVTFKIGTDLDFAQVLVQNRVASVLASLPTAVQAQGVTVQKRSTSILQIITLAGDKGQFNSLFLSNYATINLVNELSRLPGVGNVTVFGAGQYAMRVWLDPDRLKAFKLTPEDVINALKNQNSEVTAGQIGAPPAPPGQNYQYTVNVQGRLSDPAQFDNIVVKSGQGAGGQVVRIRDIGRVELGAQTYGQAFTFDGQPAAGIAIYQTPGANALAVAHEVTKTMRELARSFPPGLVWSVPFDTTLFVSASIHEVYKTLIEAGILVLLVIIVFLQDWRASLVPATTVPVTIIGAFAAMAALGFSINLSTLFAIVLAIGIVVDDAIVIVEGAAHHIERGLSAREAAIQAMRELFGPVIGITLVLMAVFVPAAFLPGLTGQMYAQFALVIAATALISAINAATLKPTQCALWLRPPVPVERRNAFYRAFNAGYDGVERPYLRLIAFMTRHSGVMVLLAVILMLLGFLGISRVPTGFLPNEDQGYLMVGVQLPNGASLERTNQAMAQVQKVAAATPGVAHVVAISGVSVLDNMATLANAGVAFVILKDWSKRGPSESLRAIYGHLSKVLATLPGATAFALVPPPIQGIGNSGGFTMMVELRDGSQDFDKLQTLTRTVVADGNAQSSLQRLNTSFRADSPAIQVDVDRTKAEVLHVSVGQVFSALSSYLGSSYVGQFIRFGRVFQVYTQADAKFRARPGDIETLSVRNDEGTMVPLGAVLSRAPTVGPALITLYNLYPAATVAGGPAPGFSSGQALSVMGDLAARVLPAGTGYDWTAMSYQEIIVGNQIIYIFALGILLVYLVLAGQYESWLAPISVILAVPLSLIGPAIVLEAIGLANNLYVQIGLILLIALSAKNAILIVEVARELRLLHGASILEAAVEAAHKRFRPILMTSIAFILGVMPLVLATGAGAAARKSIGITVASGMLASTCLAVLFVPSFFVLLQRFEEWRKPLERRARAGATELQAPGIG